MRPILLFILSGLASLTTLAQTKVTGRVFAANDSLPVIGANVILKTLQGKMAAFASTDMDGNFSLTPKTGSIDSMTINVSMIGYAPYSKPLQASNRSLTIYLEEGSLQLKEVVVKADRIREHGDTVVYSVGAFAQQQDKTIGDVLNRLPGIDVAQNGKIQYQGTDINKFYIEGSDLLGGKYGIATNGINYQDVSQVEVYENHQPMQVLRGLSVSDQAAINLKLKSSSKATLLLNGDIGAGYSVQPKGFIADGSIFAMLIRGGYQTITTIKGNNTGRNINAELIDFTSPSSSGSITPYLNLGVPTSAGLSEKRSLFNRSWYVSTNNLWKNRKGDDIKVQVDYSNNRIEGFSNRTTTYFLEDGNSVLVEDKKALTHSNELNAKFIYEANKKTYYLNNTLSGSFGWNDVELNTDGSLPNIQTTWNHDFNVENRLKLIKRFNNKLVTFYSTNRWETLPEKLSVSLDADNYGERISQYSFYTNEYASLGFIFNNTVLSLEAGVAGLFRDLKTDLYGLDTGAIEGNDIFSESIGTNYLRVYASPKLEWSVRKIDFTFSMSVSLYTYFFTGGLDNRTECFISPSLAINYRITPRLSIGVGASSKRNPASLHGIHDSAIMTDYRSFITGVDDYYTSSGQNVRFNFSYRNSHNGIFLTARTSYAWNNSHYTTVRDIIGDYAFTSYMAQPRRSNSATATFMGSKTLDFIRGVVGTNVLYTWNRNNIISQGYATRYTSNMLTVSPYINGEITKYFNWSLRFSWRRSNMAMQAMSTHSIDNYTYTGNITVLPCKLFHWTIGGEFYRSQITEQRFINMLMLDTGITFNVGKKVELVLSGTNLLNHRNYGYTTYGTLQQQESFSRLRGREFMLTLRLKK